MECNNLSVSGTCVLKKKRGRKPKGGKIVQHNFELNAIVEPSPNIILHLKCSMKDIGCTDDNSIQTHDTEFMLNKNTELNFQSIDSVTPIHADNKLTEFIGSDSQKNTYDKVKDLEKLLHFNSVNNKKSACFSKKSPCSGRDCRKNTNVIV